MKPGDVVQDRYSLEEPIGSGGMAEVWRARDDRLGRFVAVKFLAARLTDDPTFLVRFFAEAQSVARISHPHIVGVLDFGEFEDRPYLVMEHMAGGTLEGAVGEPMLPERAVEIVAQAARAAGAAHADGLVHRDIKPGNILMTDEGDVKLGDFGIAASRAAESLTQTGIAIGSPHYLSPEQASGAPVGPASDVYSLGAVLYELLTGRRPFEGDNVTAIAIAHVEQEPQPPSTYVPDLPPAIDAVVMRCLEKDPNARFADGHGLAEALESQTAAAMGTVLPPAAVATTAIPLAETAGPPVRWKGAAALAAVLLLLIAGGAFLLAGESKASAHSDPGPTATPQRETPRDKKKDRSPSPGLSPTATATGAAPSPLISPSPEPSTSETATTDESPSPKPSKSPTKSPSPEPSPTDSPSPSPSG